MPHDKSLDPLSPVVIRFEYSTKQKLQGAEELKKQKEQWRKDVNRKGGETSRQLMESDIPIPDAVVDRILHRGELMILAGAPKGGKSVITGQMAIAVAKGGKFLGEFQTELGAVLWYDVDDGNRYRT